MALTTTVRLQIIEPLRENAALLMVCVATGIIMLGQGVIGPVLPLYAQDFGVSATMVGASISVFGLARMLLNLPAGLLSDRFGRRLLLVGGPVITALGSFLSAGAGDIWQLLAFRFVAGAGSAMFMTGALILVTDISRPDNRGADAGPLPGKPASWAASPPSSQAYGPPSSWSASSPPSAPPGRCARCRRPIA